MARLNLGCVAFLSLFTVMPVAGAASIADCGNIHVEANATCEVETGVECQARCTPLSCNASLYAECSGECKLTPPSCDVSCSGTCEGKCEAAANFDCSADCRGTCDVNCESECTGHCEAEGNSAECMANCRGSCKATCQGECDASCSGSANATCSGKCQASCQGSCNARARIECQATCQAESYADCTGGCKVACQKSGEGGLFCNGQYIDHGDNFKSCVEAIQASLNIKVEGYASSSGSCSGNTCQGEAKAGGSASCALAKFGARHGASGGLLLLAATGLFAALRRKRRA